MKAVRGPTHAWRWVAVLAAAFVAATCGTDSVAPPEPVAAVMLSPEVDTVFAGAQLQMEAQLACQHGHILDRPVTWTSENSMVARVSATGMVTGVAPGAVLLSAESEGITGTATLFVMSPVAHVALSPSTSILNPKETIQLVVVLTDAAGNALQRPVTWTSANAAVATVDGSGVVKAVGVGTTAITVRHERLKAKATIVVRAPVASVIVSPASSTVLTGGTLRLKATTLTAGGDTLHRAVSWVSSDPTVALVDATGLVTGVAHGVATITAYSEGKTGMAALTIKAPVNAVSVEPAVATLDVNETVQLSAVVRDPEGNVLSRAITWTSAKTGVASVDAVGKVTALAPGATTITAASEGKTGTSAITVLVPVASVELSTTTAVLDVGQKLQLTATPRDADGNALDRSVTWASSDPSIATVDPSGFVATQAAGLVTVSATARGQIGIATLTVLVPVASVTLSPTSANLLPGETLALEAVVKDAAGNPLQRDITWTSSNDALATVDDAGVLTALQPGAVTVTGTARGKSGQAFVTIRVPVAAVVIHGSADVLSVGATLTLTATVQDAGGTPLDRPVTWSSSDPTAATVDDHGLVTGVGTGTTTITATSEGKVGSMTLTVRVPVASVEVTGMGSDPLEVGLTVQLTAIVRDAANNELTDRTIAWSSGNEAVATVSATGLVTAMGRGTTTITATSETQTATVEVRVVGEESTLGNNLSYPVIFAEGIGVSGLAVAEDPGIRPTVDEGITVDSLPFFYGGNTPDYEGTYYLQQGTNVWQAQWADGSALGVQRAEVGWGDNLTHQTWNTHAPIRIEVRLGAYTAAPLAGFNMTYLFGAQATEMQGTDGTTAQLVPAIYSVMPRLVIAKLDDDTREPVDTVFNGSVAEGLGGDGPGAFSAEVNVSGTVIYGYSLMIRDLTLSGDLHKYGWWRITFKLDDAAQIGGATVQRNTALDQLVSASEAPTYAPQIDPATNTSWVDIYVNSASGGTH